MIALLQSQTNSFSTAPKALWFEYSTDILLSCVHWFGQNSADLLTQLCKTFPDLLPTSPQKKQTNIEYVKEGQGCLKHIPRCSTIIIDFTLQHWGPPSWRRLLRMSARGNPEFVRQQEIQHRVQDITHVGRLRGLVMGFVVGLAVGHVFLENQTCKGRTSMKHAGNGMRWNESCKHENSDYPIEWMAATGLSWHANSKI